MAEPLHHLIKIPNRTYQSFARSEIKKLAKEAGFTGSILGEVEIIAAEFTSNLSKHTTEGGEILVKKLMSNNVSIGIEFLCIDNGPGISSPTKMMEDGISTTKTLGQGLGAIQRISDEFQIYSQKDWGTVILSRKFLDKKVTGKLRWVQLNVIAVPKNGEIVSGDSWGYVLKGSHFKFIIADGLGHGFNAAVAASEAIKSFRIHHTLHPDETLRRIHQDIKKTRGAVINITHIDFNQDLMTYCGVGNISAKLISLPVRNKSFVSYNGIIGHSTPTSIANHSYKWEENDILLFHSDGLKSRWDINKYPSIQKYDGSIIAAALYKDHLRGNDDVTIVVIRSKKRNS